MDVVKHCAYHVTGSYWLDSLDLESRWTTNILRDSICSSRHAFWRERYDRRQHNKRQYDKRQEASRKTGDHRDISVARDKKITLSAVRLTGRRLYGSPRE